MLHPIEDYSEDMGYVLLWRLPVDEPPYVGTPEYDDDDGWAGYYTHFQIIKAPSIKECPKFQNWIADVIRIVAKEIDTPVLDAQKHVFRFCVSGEYFMAQEYYYEGVDAEKAARMEIDEIRKRQDVFKLKLEKPS